MSASSGIASPAPFRAGSIPAWCWRRSAPPDASPHVYVYGGPDSADVRIAREIAAAQGFELDWLDKEAWRSFAPDEFPEQVARNFEAYDALPNYGELFENGANAMAREARHKDGALSVSGGCGEIFRNFFFLPDRRFSAAAVARTFYARYVRDDVTEAFDERAFLRALEDKILAALDRAGDRSRLPRPLVEQIYPRIRCRAVFGREISLEARCGAYLMPFLDHRAGRRGDEAAARAEECGPVRGDAAQRHRSGAGAAAVRLWPRFRGPAGFKHRFGEWSTRIRPVALRQRSYALRRRMGPVADEHGGLLSPDYMGRVVDLDYPVMRRFFRPARIADSGMMRRIANLEYLGRPAGLAAGRLAPLEGRDAGPEPVVPHHQPLAAPIADEDRGPAESPARPRRYCPR